MWLKRGAKIRDIVCTKCRGYMWLKIVCCGLNPLDNNEPLAIVETAVLAKTEEE